jgi:hypothetical protein
VVETAIVCVSGVVAFGFGARAFSHMNGRSAVWVACFGMVGLVAVAFAWSRSGGRRIKAELAQGQEMRQLTMEYQRLADLAITAQEHTDLKLGDLSARLDHMREQIDSLQKILKEVE